MDIHLHPRDPATDEVLRRIGRNLLNFQLVEHLLKRLTAMRMPSGPVNQMAARFEKHAAAINTSTMGALAGELMDRFLNPDYEEKTPDKVDEIQLGFRVCMEVDNEFRERHAREMQALVGTRNDLVHHFLPKWNAAIAGDIADALQYLDKQLAESMRMMDRLREWVKTLEAGAREHAAFMASAEGRQQLELGLLRTSPLVTMLGEAALQRPRGDGWTTLKAATRLVRSRAPEELVELQERFGVPNLREVMLRTGFFEVQDEEVPGGRTRTIYRIGKEWTFTPSSPAHLPAASVVLGEPRGGLPVAPDDLPTALPVPAHAAAPACAGAPG